MAALWTTVVSVVGDSSETETSRAVPEFVAIERSHEFDSWSYCQHRPVEGPLLSFNLETAKP